MIFLLSISLFPNSSKTLLNALNSVKSLFSTLMYACWRIQVLVLIPFILFTCRMCGYQCCLCSFHSHVSEKLFYVILLQGALDLKLIFVNLSSKSIGCQWVCLFVCWLVCYLTPPKRLILMSWDFWDRFTWGCRWF